MPEEKKTPETDAPPPAPEWADAWDQSGLCDEAQADGVPCPDLGRDCEICERARRPRRPVDRGA